MEGGRKRKGWRDKEMIDGRTRKDWGQGNDGRGTKK